MHGLATGPGKARNVPTPNGVTAPKPVTTTRRILKFEPNLGLGSRWYLNIACIMWLGRLIDAHGWVKSPI